MYTGTYRIAGRSISIESQYPDVHAYCAAYRHAGEPDFTIRITPADIDRERDKSAREDQRQGIAPRAFPEGYLEELAVYRQIADRMPAYDTLLIHGSARRTDFPQADACRCRECRRSPPLHPSAPPGACRR